MSRITKLIEELCPNGVEYKKIEQLFKLSRGVVISKDFIRDNVGNYPVYSSQTENDGELGKINTYEFDGEYLTWTTDGANAGTVFYRKGKFSVTNVCGLLTPITNNNTKFIYYALQINAQDYVVKGMGNAKLMSNVMSKILVPVPPRPIQDEIVRILDNFTELTAELTAELTDRRKQYEYYRDYLLTPKSNIEYKKISDFATITRGGSFQKSDFVDVGRPAIHYGKIYTNYGISTSQTLNYINEEVFNKSRKAQPNDIVMAVTSENVEDVCKCVAWLGNEDVAVSGHTAIIHHNQNPKYLSYYFHTSMFAKQKEKLAHGTKVIEVTPDRLNDIEIPIPPMDVQNRIVEVLDNFDKICNDFEIGLPAEVEMRQKQYEFFRDKLLTFDLNLERILQTDRQTSDN